jgi:uncharacterized membrane protein YeaQ/YmgE (transglycosylase-associated protein family)
MITARTDVMGTTPKAAATAEEVQYERWNHWPVNWTAVWTGALASIAIALIIGLIGLALGAYLLGPEHRVVDFHKLSIGALIFSVCGAFFAFVAGGWTAGKIAGILHSEPAMLHGAIVWLVAVPLLVVLIGFGAGSLFGGWYAGLAGTPAWASASTAPFERPDPLDANATEAERAKYRTALEEYRQQVKQWREDTPRATRNSALGAVTALLLGLVGSVIGGWMASGEPMSLTYRRKRREAAQMPV